MPSVNNLIKEYLTEASPAEQGVALHDMNVHLQLDNTASTNKNATVLAFAASCVQMQLCRSLTISFLRVGHTHEANLGWGWMTQHSDRYLRPKP